MDALIDPALLSARLVGDWGLKLVVLGVIGEVLAAIFEFISEKFFDEWHKKWKSSLRLAEIVAGGVLIFGLAMEYKGHKKETNILDSDNAKLHERAANTESNNLVLRSNVASLETAVIGLAHLYDQSTNALAEANSRLASIRPLKQRLIEWLNQIDSSIIPSLQDGKTNFSILLPLSEIGTLSAFSREPEAA